MTYIKKEQQSTPNINGWGHFLYLFLNKTRQRQLSCDNFEWVLLFEIVKK